VTGPRQAGRRRRQAAAGAALGLALAAACTALAGCGGTGHGGAAGSDPAVVTTVPPGRVGAAAPPMSPVRTYLRAVRLAVRDHLRVWIEADLVTRWEAGRASFEAGVRRVAFLARQPGVAGVKIADELGYQDGLTTPADIESFLAQAARALRAAAPGRQILVDMVVPELGCLPGHQPPGSPQAACAASARAKYPQLSLPEVDTYLRLHAIDVLDLSTYLQAPATYARWGTTLDAAQRDAWRAVTGLGWPRLVRLQGRKALAHSRDFAGGQAAADAQLRTFVDIPLESGAHAVDIWTWHQEYDGAMYRILDPGLRPNALWHGLRQRRRAHDVLFTHMSPTSLDGGLARNLKLIASVFSDLFLPAGTG